MINDHDRQKWIAVFFSLPVVITIRRTLSKFIGYFLRAKGNHPGTNEPLHSVSGGAIGDGDLGSHARLLEYILVPSNAISMMTLLVVLTV